MTAATTGSAHGDVPGPESGSASPVAEIGALETSGLAIRALPDGTMVATAQRVSVRELRARTRLGAVDIARVVFTGVIAHLSASVAGSRELIDLSADEIRIEALNGIVNDVPSPSAALSLAVLVDAIGDLDGIVRAFITDALWIIDAEIVVPVARGRIDFNRVIVEHIGPNSTMSIDPGGIHVRAPHRARVDLFAFENRDVPGVSSSAASGVRSRARDRGRLDLAPFIRAVFAAPRDRPLLRLADSRLNKPLQRTRVSGELRMGDGSLGTPTHCIALTGRAQGKNNIELSSAAVGRRLIVRMPQLAATSAVFAISDKTLTTGAVSAALDVHLIGIDEERSNDGGSAAIAVAVHEATVQRVKLAASVST